MLQLLSMSFIRDPVHGLIELGEKERQLVDTLVLQRSRRIRQLGVSEFVYPSARHA